MISNYALDDMLDSFPTLEFSLDNNYTYKWRPRDYLFNDDASRPLTLCIPWERIG